MYSIILSIQKPDAIDHEARRKYDDTVNILANLAKHNTSNRLLGEGVLLLPLNQGLQDVVDVLHSVRSLSCSYALLTEDLQWYEAFPTSI